MTRVSRRIAAEYNSVRGVHAAAREHQNLSAPSRILVVCGAARTDKSCPGEMSKTFRLVQMAREEIEKAGAACDVLDLSV